MTQPMEVRGTAALIRTLAAWTRWLLLVSVKLSTPHVLSSLPYISSSKCLLHCKKFQIFYTNLTLHVINFSRYLTTEMEKHFFPEKLQISVLSTEVLLYILSDMSVKFWSNLLHFIVVSLDKSFLCLLTGRLVIYHILFS